MPDEPIDTMVGNLDMANGHDRALLRRAIRARWAVSDDRKMRLLEKLDAALEHGDIRDIISVGKLFVTMEAQNQSDEHTEEKHARTDDGKPDAITEIRVTRATKELPSGDD